MNQRPMNAAIAGRLREIRKNYSNPISGRPLSQTAFASIPAVSIGRARLASYEENRAALPARIASSICQTTDTSPIWLATGIGPKDGWFELISASDSLRDRSLLQLVCEKWDTLVDRARSRSNRFNDLPANPPYAPEEIGKRPPHRTAATGRIRVSQNDIRNRFIDIPTEFRPGCEGEDYEQEIRLSIPPWEAAQTCLESNRPTQASNELLRKSLNAHARGSNLLEKMDPHFVAELKLAAKKLAGLVDPDE